VQMKTRVAGVLATSACAVAMIGGPAFASTCSAGNHVTNVGNISILSGNTVNIPISIPVDVCGNAIAILGFAEASCQGGAGVFLGSPGSGW
jgi:ChpA-C